MAADAAWEQAAEFARQMGDDRERAEILSWVASSAFIGPTSVEQAVRRSEAILEQVREDRRSTAATMYPLAGLYAMIGRFHAARERLEQACQTLEDLGFITLTSSFMLFDAYVEILSGDLARAEKRLRLGLSRLEDMGERAFVSSLAALLAEVLYKQGRYDEAKRFVDRSRETAAPDDLAAQITWRTARAKILATTGRLEDAEADARRAVSLAEGTDWSMYHAAACLALAEVHRARSRPAEAETAIRKSLALYEKKGNVIEAAAAHAMLSSLVPA